MKKIASILIISCLTILASCSDFLDPLPNGNFTDKNYKEFPSLIRGLIDKGYALLPTTYNSNEFLVLDCATDDIVHRSSGNVMRKFAAGALSPGSDPFATYWSRDYQGINYANMFLEDNLGRNTRYLTDPKSDSVLRCTLQGDAYALRAWFQLDLLKKFGGKATNGEYLGFPIILKPTEADEIDPASLKRNTYEECLRQIIADCDSAYKYLPLANRDFLVEGPQNVIVLGSIRYKAFDGISTVAMKALAYLTWASPAFNPQNDKTRWEKAAEYAATVMKFKLEVDGSVSNGFDPNNRFLWTDPNSPEIIFPSNTEKNGSMETACYPNGFQGNGNFGPTQELVDAFPMANGYPIDDPRGRYDPQNPYANRDPRFYATLFYNGAQAKRISNQEVMYTFDTYEGGKDVAGMTNTSPTNYYIKKYLYMGWNKSDNSVETAARCIFLIRWSSMCLAFAEAANRVVGPLNDSRFGFSAKQAIAYLRNRPTNDGTDGIGTNGSDPYLDECAAAGPEAFEALIRNERRLETCLEGQRFFDLRRWATRVDDLNKPVSKIVITPQGDGTFSYKTEQVETRKFYSLYLPIPYTEMKRAKGLLQNEGWETWK